MESAGESETCRHNHTRATRILALFVEVGVEALAGRGRPALDVLVLAAAVSAVSAVAAVAAVARFAVRCTTKVSSQPLADSNSEATM